jgi:carboxyl-terminal processing protease
MKLLLLLTVMADNESRLKKIDLFSKILYTIETQYYREVDMEKLIDGAINGMMSSLDPHSIFLDKDEFTKLRESTEGEFGGLGIEVTQKDGAILIIAPIDDGPAALAGIKSGDKIVEINGESTIGLTLSEAVDKMKGKQGTEITLGVLRSGAEEVLSYKLMRKLIRANPVKLYPLLDDYYLIRISQFSKGMTKNFVDAIEKLRKDNKNIAGLIINLRNNPGGLLDEAVELVSIFLKDGVVVSVEGRNSKDREVFRIKDGGLKLLNMPLAVLINSASASASEIVAGSLQDHKRALIIGERSFGKGSVQSVAKIDESSGMKMTIAQYMTPTGKKIQAIGIIPDIEVKNTEFTESKDPEITREIDLRNHLTATITSEDEKKLIEENKRVAKRKKSEEKDDGLYNPLKDYVVMQGVNYLKSFKIYSSMLSNEKSNNK